MAEEARTEEGGQESEEKRRAEIQELRESRKKEARKKLCIVSANVYGIQGTYRMLNCLGDGLEAEVVVIQESKCSKEEERSLEARLSRQGWYMYHLPGTTTKVARGKAQGKGGGHPYLCMSRVVSDHCAGYGVQHCGLYWLVCRKLNGCHMCLEFV